MRTRNRFLLDCLMYVVRGVRMPSGHRPQPTLVPEFTGVCVASQEDPEADASMIGYLNELGIRHVRMDFTYDSLQGMADAF